MLIKYEYSGKLSLQCRLEFVNDEFIQRIITLKNNNCDVLLEFGIQTLVKEEMNVIERYNNLTKIKRVIAVLNEYQIRYEISLIYGLPTQTLNSFKYSVNTVQSMVDKNICEIKAFPLMILRGTKLDTNEIRNRYDIIEDSELPHEFFQNITNNKQRQLQNIPHVIQTNTFNVKDWMEMSRIACAL